MNTIIHLLLKHLVCSLIKIGSICHLPFIVKPILFHIIYHLGIVITACLPIHKNDDTFMGVACVDMLMRDLISDLTAFPNLNVGYTFMLDSAGNISRNAQYKDIKKKEMGNQKYTCIL